LFREWSPKLERFARYLEALPEQGAPVEEKAALAFARDVLDVATEMQDASMSLVDQLELARIGGGFDKPNIVETYAIENRLVRRDLNQIAVTDLGRTFLRLRGQDAIRWLLTVEVAQNRIAYDPWRASRGLLTQALSSNGITQRFDENGELNFPFATTTLQRLADLEIVVGYYDPWGTVDCYLVRDSMRELVQHVIDDGPWHAAVVAFLEDERADVLPVFRLRSIDIAVEQTRLIAHEVRNALIPVRHHVDALLKTADAASRARLERSRQNVVRVLAFVDEMVATSELVSEPLTFFDVGDVIRDARGWLDEGERVELELPERSLRVRGRRSRLQRAVSNVLLNALQATSAGHRVRAQARQSAGRVEILVDDGGPGVPEESRSIVFRDGFTTRGGGAVAGSGSLTSGGSSRTWTVRYGVRPAISVARGS
jgi:signal transduction histidine kinase